MGEQGPVEEQVDAHDRRVLERRVGLVEQPSSLGGRRGDDDGIGIEIVERDDALAGANGCAGRLERPARGVAVHPARAAAWAGRRRSPHVTRAALCAP